VYRVFVDRLPRPRSPALPVGFHQLLTGGARGAVLSRPAATRLGGLRPGLCCHTLLIDDGSRHRSCCLLLLSHVDADEVDLRAQAATYGHLDDIAALLRHLETHGEVDDDWFPAWEEFQKLAADYEVQLA
jgi:hypothetical protein